MIFSIPMAHKTSFTLHHTVVDKLRSTPGVRDNINAFAVAATDAFIAAKSKPTNMRRLGLNLRSIVARESPFTFYPPRSGYSLSYYKAVAKRHDVSLSALVANSVTAALGIHPLL